MWVVQSKQDDSDAPERFLRIGDVVALTGLSKSGVYAAAANGTFPPQHKIGRRAVAWRSSQVERWMQERVAEAGDSWQRRLGDVAQPVIEKVKP
jgi:prophage regulatory protein